MVAVRLPPAPAAVVVLQVVEPAQAVGDLAVEHRSRSVGASSGRSSARVTTRLGTKLESVCSVQPYGKLT